MNILTGNPTIWLILSMFIFSYGHGQTWQDLQVFGNENAQSLSVLAQSGDQLYIGGTFTGQWELGGTSLQSQGEEDIFLATLDTEGQIQIVLAGGSIRGDQLYELNVDSQGNIILAGSVWEEASFGSFSVVAPENSPKVEFLLKLSTQGEVLWSQILAGGSIKGINGVSLDMQDRILVGGYYGDSLRIADTLLRSGARSAAFLAYFSPDGQLNWARSIGRSGNTRITTTDLFGGSHLFAAGYYDDTLRVDGEVFPANTNDEDAFLSCFTPSGELRWVRKAGGVFDEQPTAIACDEEGNTYLTGQIVGVMRLNDSLSIQSRDGNADCFLVKFDSLGRVPWAESFGGDQLQLVRDISYRDGQLNLCGSFQENLFWQDLSLQSTFGYDGYLARLDTSGQLQDLQSLPSSAGIVLPRRLFTSGESVLLGGEFSGSLALGPFMEEAPAGGFGLFLSAWGPAVTSVRPTVNTIAIRIFPNPTADFFQIKTTEVPRTIRVFAASGQMIYQQEDSLHPIAVHHWLPGTYWIQVVSSQGQAWQPLVVH
jgi:hypothetical protein